LIDSPAENVSSKNERRDLKSGLAQLALYHRLPFFLSRCALISRSWMKVRDEALHTQVGRASACLPLTYGGIAKIKSRQAEARPTKIDP
jgi:hypothetical protein